MKNTERFKQFISACDFVLVGLVLFLCIGGLVVIYSAVRDSNNPVVYSSFRSQIIWLATGLAVMVIFAVVDYQFICKFYIPLAVLAIALLVVVLFIPPLRENFPRRWLHIPGYSPNVQPSEFSKLFLLIFFAKYIDKMQEKINNILVILSMLVIGLLPVGLIIIQPSLTAGVLQLVILLVVLYLSGIKYKYIVIGFLVAVPLFLFFIYDLNREEHLIVDSIFESYQLEDRIKPFFGINVTDDNTHQSERSVQAIGSGQLIGKGLFNNTVIVPLAHNDFIFTIIGAEFGFIGCILVIIVMFMVILKCFAAAERSDSLCGKLLASGIGAMIGAQAFLHIGVTTQILPNTGIPLPFISAGGSSMWINLAAIGIVLNVGMKPARNNIFADG
ncbi:MAG: FtsW/RodA/SpoVE family cell cycle protein [Defluviitaleaceae bacterium]|nr:FtsW/RodA/SpoVE family cell cycle protein [Defluviitaleaceae bacterium]MCL2836804.1 FtsW/RodA/SpoVE family cell cycle protein [Defluviitaleaceae bacterium]